MFSIKQKAKQTVKRAGLLTGGLVFCAVGVGFLTVAAWIYLANVLSVQLAALIIGGAYVGAGLILIGLGNSRSHHVDPMSLSEHATKPAPPPNVPPLLQALLFGIEAGSKVSRK